jgi:hypothetical protein
MWLAGERTGETKAWHGGGYVTKNKPGQGVWQERISTTPKGRMPGFCGRESRGHGVTIYVRSYATRESRPRIEWKIYLLSIPSRANFDVRVLC